MTGATHLLAGAAVYSLARTNFRRIRNIAPLGLALAFCSHFLLDAIPHYELGMPWQYALAAVAGAFILLAGRGSGEPLLLPAGIAGLLPDIICILKISPAFIRLHDFFHFKAVFVVPLSAAYLEGAFDLGLAFILAVNELNPLPAAPRRR